MAGKTGATFTSMTLTVMLLVALRLGSDGVEGIVAVTTLVMT